MRIRIDEQPASEEEITRIITSGARSEEIPSRKRLLRHLKDSCYLKEGQPEHALNARERLLAQYQNDGLVLFLGAGVSVESGIPNWNCLIEDMFRKVEIGPDIAKRAASSSIYAQFELVALLTGGQKDFCKKLYDCLYGRVKFKHLKQLLNDIPCQSEEQPGWKGWDEVRKELEKNETLRDVGDLLILHDSDKQPFKRNPQIHAVLTVNADNLLELYCLSKVSGNPHCPVTMVDRASVGDDPGAISIYHLHGTLDARDENFRRMSPCVEDEVQEITVDLLPRLVFQESEYYETIANPTSFVNHAPQSYFQRFNVLFIGTSLDDLNIRRWLYSSFQERVEQRTKYLQELHCKIYPAAKFEAELESVRHFWLHTKIDCKGVEISYKTMKLVERLVRKLGVQVVWCNDFSDMRQCIRELSAKRLEA